MHGCRGTPCGCPDYGRPMGMNIPYGCPWRDITMTIWGAHTERPYHAVCDCGCARGMYGCLCQNVPMGRGTHKRCPYNLGTSCGHSQRRVNILHQCSFQCHATASTTFSASFTRSSPERSLGRRVSRSSASFPDSAITCVCFPWSGATKCENECRSVTGGIVNKADMTVDGIARCQEPVVPVTRSESAT
jgi:hypothetical protein